MSDQAAGDESPKNWITASSPSIVWGGKNHLLLIFTLSEKCIFYSSPVAPYCFGVVLCFIISCYGDYFLNICICYVSALSGFCCGWMFHLFIVFIQNLHRILRQWVNKLLATRLLCQHFLTLRQSYTLINAWIQKTSPVLLHVRPINYKLHHRQRRYFPKHSQRWVCRLISYLPGSH